MITSFFCMFQELLRLGLRKPEVQSSPDREAMQQSQNPACDQPQTEGLGGEAANPADKFRIKLEMPSAGLRNYREVIWELPEANSSFTLLSTMLYEAPLCSRQRAMDEECQTACEDHHSFSSHRQEPPPSID